MGEWEAKFERAEGARSRGSARSKRIPQLASLEWARIAMPSGALAQRPNAALDAKGFARNALEIMKFSLGVARRAAAGFSLATMTAVGCSTFGSGEPSDAGSSPSDTGTGTDTSVRPIDSATSETLDAGTEVDAAEACTTEWSTTFETLSALNSPPWDRSMVGTSLKLAIDLADALSLIHISEPTRPY